MTDLILGLGVALAIEGTLYALFPTQMRAMLTRVLGQPDRTFRVFGIGALIAGLVLVWLVRG